MNRHLAFLALVLFMVPSLRAEAGELPATLSVEGKGPLTLAIDWRRELVPRLDSAATAHIQGFLHRFSMATRSLSNTCRGEERLCG